MNELLYDEDVVREESLSYEITQNNDNISEEKPSGEAIVDLLGEEQENILSHCTEISRVDSRNYYYQNSSDDGFLLQMNRFMKKFCTEHIIEKYPIDELYLECLTEKAYKAWVVLRNNDVELRKDIYGEELSLSSEIEGIEFDISVLIKSRGDDQIIHDLEVIKLK